MLFMFIIKIIEMKNIEEILTGVMLSSLLAAGITLVIIIFMAITADHAVSKYYLRSYTGSNQLVINGYIDWGEDEKIILDRSVTLEEAIELVDKLNKSLPK